jgi:hypothetical protein
LTVFFANGRCFNVAMAYAIESKEGDRAAFTTDAPAPVRVVCRIRPSLYGGRISAAAVKGEDGEDAVELYQTNKNTIQRAKVKGEAPRRFVVVGKMLATAYLSILMHECNAALLSYPANNGRLTACTVQKWTP